MKLRTLVRGLAACGLVLSLGTVSGIAQSTPSTTQDRSQDAVSEEQASQDDALAKRRERIVADAVVALEATNEVIAALEKEDASRALSQLEVAMGKLELLMSRHPEAAMLPVAVDVSEVDVVGSNEEVERVVERATEALENGKIQFARRLLMPLGSEVVFSTTELPLAAYPLAMRRVAPLIDAGRNQQAIMALRAALETLVVRTDIVPLPVLRAEFLLARAEAQLAASPEVEAAEGEAAESEGSEGAAQARRNALAEPPAEDLLAGARRQLDRAAILGYGKARSTYPELVERIEKLEQEVASGSDAESSGRLAKIRESLSRFGSSLLN